MSKRNSNNNVKEVYPTSNRDTTAIAKIPTSKEEIHFNNNFSKTDCNKFYNIHRLWSMKKNQSLNSIMDHNRNKKFCVVESKESDDNFDTKPFINGQLEINSEWPNKNQILDLSSKKMDVMDFYVPNSVPETLTSSSTSQQCWDNEEPLDLTIKTENLSEETNTDTNYTGSNAFDNLGTIKPDRSVDYPTINFSTLSSNLFDSVYDADDERKLPKKTKSSVIINDDLATINTTSFKKSGRGLTKKLKRFKKKTVSSTIVSNTQTSTSEIDNKYLAINDGDHEKICVYKYTNKEEDNILITLPNIHAPIEQSFHKNTEQINHTSNGPLNIPREYLEYKPLQANFSILEKTTYANINFSEPEKIETVNTQFNLIKQENNVIIDPNNCATISNKTKDKIYTSSLEIDNIFNENKEMKNGLHLSSSESWKDVRDNVKSGKIQKKSINKRRTRKGSSNKTKTKSKCENENKLLLQASNNLTPNKPIRTYINNMIDVSTLLDNEMNFMQWYMSDKKFLELYPKKKLFLVRQLMKNIEKANMKKACIWNANYSDLLPPICNKKLKLVAVMPFRKNEARIDLILRKIGSPLGLRHVVLRGLNQKYLFELRSLKPSYLVDPDVAILNNIQGAFIPLTLSKYIGPDGEKMFITGQINGKDIFISLAPSTDLFYSKDYITSNAHQKEQSF